MKGPRFVAPQLATLVDAVPSSDDGIFEIKYDGNRLQAIIANGSASLLTRRGNDWTMRVPELGARLTRLKAKSAILDGEVVVLDKSGISRFALLQESLDTDRAHTLTYLIFDLLEIDGGHAAFRGSSDSPHATRPHPWNRA